MKKLILLSAALFGLLFNVNAQSPEGFKYQAVVRDGSNLIMTDTEVGIQMTIRQGAFDGTSVYSETFAPTTNSYGLVNLEIGSGLTSDDFSAIDWADGPYFIETAIDFTGGTAYEVIGSSQLMSVPYALHSKTAEGISGGELDPVFEASVAAGITVEDIAEWEDHTIDTDTHIDSAGIAALGFVAGPHTEDTNLDSAGIAALGYVAGDHIQTYEIGDFAQGGVVIAVDESGLHGLVVAIEDLDDEYAWATGTETYVWCPAERNGIGGGNFNTMGIIATHGAGASYGNYAAYQASFYRFGHDDFYFYSDWYLPSANEMNHLHYNFDLINEVSLENGGDALRSDLPYWSSNQDSGTPSQAYRIHLVSGAWIPNSKEAEFPVRPVRRF